MASGKQVEAFPIDPLFSFRLRQAGPGKRTVRIRLILVIDDQSVVCCGSAKLVAFGPLLRHIQVFPVDQQRAFGVTHAKAEGISMAVTTSSGAQRTGVNRNLYARYRIAE